MKLGAAHPMGPLELLDFVGLDVAVAIGEAIGARGAGADAGDWSPEGALGRKKQAGASTVRLERRFRRLSF